MAKSVHVTARVREHYCHPILRDENGKKWKGFKRYWINYRKLSYVYYERWLNVMLILDSGYYASHILTIVNKGFRTGNKIRTTRLVS